MADQAEKEVCARDKLLAGERLPGRAARQTAIAKVVEDCQADGISFKVVTGVHWAAAIRHIASVPEDRELLEEKFRLQGRFWPNDQISKQHLAPVPSSPVTLYLRSELNNAEISLLQVLCKQDDTEEELRDMSKAAFQDFTSDMDQTAKRRGLHAWAKDKTAWCKLVRHGSDNGLDNLLDILECDSPSHPPAVEDSYIDFLHTCATPSSADDDSGFFEAASGDVAAADVASGHVAPGHVATNHASPGHFQHQKCQQPYRVLASQIGTL
ncbi:hypothetical protein WJX79_004667 [Trebouxia sp. C0005]